MKRAGTLGKWLTPGIGVKRWLLLLMIGVALLAAALALALVTARGVIDIRRFVAYRGFEILVVALFGVVFIGVSLMKLMRNLLAPYRPFYQKTLIDAVYNHSRRQKGPKVVVIGGGTGLPSAIKGLKAYTTNLTAVVTVADDGGSSGRLRRDLGVLPPGDLRNNIAALADDENLMTQLFQYRFKEGALDGHAFGNLFISALSGVTGSLESALIETERVLNIHGRVLPATLHDVHLSADVVVNNTRHTIAGESNITAAGGRIERLSLVPEDIEAYQGSVQAILDAEIIVIGPGSLYTSILPNLLVNGIAEALRATSAYKIYVCNIAMQPGETTDFTVADHVLALEKHVGRGMFQVVLANDAHPTVNAGVTRYVQPAPGHHEILQRYTVCYADLVDAERPWRHSPDKLVAAILSLSEVEKPRARQTLATISHIH
jgi:uncharacterized cofD-like protein